MAFHSFMRNAVTISTPASAASGIEDITGASRNIETTSTSACTMPVMRVTAPLLTATLVRAMAAVGKARPLPGDDRNDIAAYFHPGDPEPTGAELITALNEAGVHTGIAAFNPPGTSPPLEGLAVPEDFELPEGYVRHHQATDDGEVIEPILMFAPDFELTDANGQPVDLPDNRVVTAELAPPGLPLRQVRIPGQ